MGMKRIGVLTSGSDGPGFNPCLRAVVRMAEDMGLQVTGIRHGFQGLVNGEMVELDSRAVSGIISKGGTILGTLPSKEFMERMGQLQALRHLNEADIEGLIVIGGDGSMRGAHQLQMDGFPVIGVPGTVENDLLGTDDSIGVDTALNTALDAIDKIKDTASSHQRAFLVEVMGRGSGYLALMAGIAGGAEMVCIPGVPFELDDVEETVTQAYVRGKSHCILVMAEGAECHIGTIAEFLDRRFEEGLSGFKVEVTILGQIQRGGSPSAYDRVLATRLGAAAVQRLVEGHQGEMMGLRGNDIVATPLADVVTGCKPLSPRMLQLASILAR